MANFDELLESLHGGISFSDDETEPITITSKRTFEIPKNYNTVIGYAGDVNSQIITFVLPLSHDSHILQNCHYKKIKWKNLTSGVEGSSDLVRVTDQLSDWRADWEVPPEAMTHAGKLEVAISLYDIDNSVIAFSWNTSVYRGFSIGESFVEVGPIFETKKFPAKNEILIVNSDMHSIVAPKGYNTMISNYGDIGTSKVYFQVNKKIADFELSSHPVYVTVTYGNGIAADVEISEREPMYNNNEQYLLCWNVPPEITCNSDYYVGPISIALKLQETDAEQKIIKRWTTTPFTKLSIGPSLVTQDINALATRDEEIVYKAIDNYFDNREFIIDNDK